MSGRRLRAGAALLLALALAGCAGGDVDAARARLLQDDVLAVSTAAAQGDLDAAAVLLDRLRAQVEDAHADGDLSDARHDEVTAALDDVAAQLESGLAAQAAAAQAEATAARDAAVAAAVAEAQARASEAEAREAAAREAAAREAARPPAPGPKDREKAEEEARKEAEKAADAVRQVAEKAAEKAREAAARRGPGG